MYGGGLMSGFYNPAHFGSRWRRPLILVEERCQARGLISQGDRLELREARGKDFLALEQLRGRDREWLVPWEATVPPGTSTAPTLSEYIVSATKDARRGRGMFLALVVDGVLVGQVTLSGVERGATQSGSIGYWVGSRFAGNGYTPLAVAMLIDWAFQEASLHRIEINIRPENRPSIRIPEKLGMRFEGVRERYLHIDHHWADHNSYAITAEEVAAGGLVHRLESAGNGVEQSVQQ